MNKGEFENVTKLRVFNRDGRRCQKCGKVLTANVRMNIHHRSDRSMGGTSNPLISFPSNALTLCGSGSEGCHGEVTVKREIAFEHGWAVKVNALATSAQVPVLGRNERGEEQWYRLHDDYTRTPIHPIEAYYILVDLGIRKAAA